MERVARRALRGEADLMTWPGVYSIPGRSLIARIAKKVLVLPGAGADSGQAKQELGGEELLTNSPLRLQKPTVPPAARAGDGSAQESSIFGGYSQIEGHSASRILTGGPVNYSVSGCGTRFMFYSGLHVSSLLSSWRKFWFLVVLDTLASLDVRLRKMFHAIAVPPDANLGEAAKMP
jgi:hypothetical protein